MDAVFTLANLGVLPFWFLMIVVPGWRVTRLVIGSTLILVPFLLLYAVLVVPRLPEIIPVVANPKLDAIAAALGTPEGATLGWVHFLAFDLFVGRWVYLDSTDLGISGWLTTPILVLTLMVGPLGLLVYLPIRESGPAAGSRRKPMQMKSFREQSR